MPTITGGAVPIAIMVKFFPLGVDSMVYPLSIKLQACHPQMPVDNPVQDVETAARSVQCLWPSLVRFT